MNKDVKVESGMQLLARLTKKQNKSFCKHTIFPEPLKSNDTVEIFGGVGSGKTLLLADLITDIILPRELSGNNNEVLILHTDGNLSPETLISLLKEKIFARVQRDNDIDSIIEDSCTRMHFLEIYDATQLYITINNLESVLMDYPNASFIIIDTLTAFYWSEQEPIKMELYVKNILKLLKKCCSNHSLIIMYVRPEYFNSSQNVVKDIQLENQLFKPDYVTHKICLHKRENESFQVIINKYESNIQRTFRIQRKLICWS